MKKNIVLLVYMFVGLLFGSSIMHVPLDAAVPAEERAALIALYNSTNGDNWKNNSGWKDGPLEPDGFGAVGSEGTWYGITISKDHVVEMALRRNNLNGIIPVELADLSNLTMLGLSSNQLSGNIPHELGNLQWLTDLSLAENQLSGSIPVELVKLSNLTVLGLSYNQLSGTIPPELGNLSKLTMLALGTNQLSGSIPPELGDLTGLTTLYLGTNQMSGTIPPELGNLTKLTVLDLGNNQLTGRIPPELGNLSMIYLLYLNSNQLSGSIPPELGNLTRVYYFHLDNNQLSGSIPPELGNFSQLYWFTLHSNQLNGNIPPELGKLTNLRILYLNSNQLSGSIPPELGNLTYLNHLKLDSNRLNGSFPPELANLSDLSRLYLESNRLTGKIPAELANLTSLVDDKSRFRWNGLYTDDEALRDYLNSKQEGGDWESTQTIAPINVSTLALSSTSVRVRWTPISYTADSGGYEIYYSTLSSGPWTSLGITTDKTADYYDVTGLSPRHNGYYFMVRTRTLSHQHNSNAVVSENSENVPGTTVIPAMVLDRLFMFFGFVSGDRGSPSQTVSITGIPETVNWDIIWDEPWLQVSPYYGNGTGTVSVSVDPSQLPAGEYRGTLYFYAWDTINPSQNVTVYLTVYDPGATSIPFGDFATPVDGSIVTGSIPVTGWALDDIGVESVKIYRKEGEHLIYIGDAAFVDGARPDIETAYPNYPMNYRAGWGYMMLTNFLPDNGNGTFTLHAIATDTEGNQVTLGTKTITCDNANAVKPFGAIDTPNQGGTAAGPAFHNHGWVLTPPPNAIPTDGSSINVYVDGVYLGHPVYDIYRSDIAGLFPGYTNSDGAHAYFDIDTTVYENGVHSIFWTAEDDAGNTDGIGSRYFVIQNSAGNTDRAARGKGTGGGLSTITEIPADCSGPVRLKKGYNKKDGMETVYPGHNGTIDIEIQELDRVELHLGDLHSSSPVTHPPSLFTGYSIVGDRIASLPIGSTLNSRGVFYWQAGAGFLGEYRFVFVGAGENGEPIRKDVRIFIHPKSE